MTVSDINLKTIEALRLGDHNAFDQVFIVYYFKIKNFIYGLLKSEADAEELTQDLFMKLWINHEKIDPQKSLNALLYTMARNAAFNFLEHKLVHDSFISRYPQAESSESPDELLFAKEKELLIRLMVQQMPVQRKRIYQMSKEEGLTNDRIAQELNISKKTVENQLSLALKDIRNVISCFLAIFL